MNKLHKEGASSLAHFFRTRAGIPSGPRALFTSRFLSKSATSAAVTLIEASLVVVVQLCTSVFELIADESVNEE